MLLVPEVLNDAQADTPAAFQWLRYVVFVLKGTNLAANFSCYLCAEARDVQEYGY